MKTIVVTEEEIEEIADKLRELGQDISDATINFDPDDENNYEELLAAVELSEIHVGDVLAEVEGIQERLTPSGEGESDLSDQRVPQIDQRRLLGASKNALLAALNSLDGVRGHDSTSPLDNNKAEIPISQSDLATIKSLVKGAIELHGADLSSNHVRLALSELLTFLREIYDRLKQMAVVVVTGSILYVLAQLFQNAIDALDALLTGFQSIAV